MMAQKIEITRDDLMSMTDYEAERKERRTKMTALKRNRRISIGPDATFYFESYATMFHQIHEMLWIEKGGEAQISDELEAYNPLIPKGRELVATLMFEIDDENRRARFLAGLGGVEERVSIAFNGQNPVLAKPEEDIDRTTADGKASAIQFLHFPFDEDQITLFKDKSVLITLGITHEKYGHMATLSADVRDALMTDFIV